MTTFHRIVGTIIVLLLIVIVVAGPVLRLTGTTETPRWLWLVQRWTENLLGLQLAAGVILLVIGRRVTGEPFAWFHYLYGSLFPMIAIIAGRLAGLRRGEREYVGLSWGAFVALALVLRAVQTACGTGVAITTCLARW